MSSPFPASSSAAGEGRIVARLLPSGSPGLEVMSYTYPLKLISPSRSSETRSALVFLLSYGGGLVGGDHVRLAIDVRAGARLSAVTQGHTKIFNSPAPDVVTRQTLDVRVERGAALCLLPDPVQPFAGSVYEQKQVFRLAGPDASLCLLDWVTQGRSARGENWSLARWKGRNEVWLAPPVAPAAAEGGEAKERLLVRDAVVLDASQSASTAGTPLPATMHGMGVVGTLILRGPLMRALGDFFLAEFAALPRLGARDFRGDGDGDGDGDAAAAELGAAPSLGRWRADRLRLEKEQKVLWSAACARGCFVVKFGAATVEGGRLWVGAMLVREGSVAASFGEQALMCVRS